MATADRLLPHLAAVCRRARRNAELLQRDVATEARVATSTVHRFETAQAWPRDVDTLVIAYATLTRTAVAVIWQRAAAALNQATTNT